MKDRPQALLLGVIGDEERVVIAQASKQGDSERNLKCHNSVG
jgi:hypothetical protein